MRAIKKKVEEEMSEKDKGASKREAVTAAPKKRYILFAY